MHIHVHIYINMRMYGLFLIKTAEIIEQATEVTVGGSQKAEMVTY